MASPPLAAVRAAFGADGAPRPLAGGQRTVWQIGDLVLKELDGTPESIAWQAGVLGAVGPQAGVRVAPPVRSSSGEWVVDGWTAWRFVEGRPGGSDWPGIAEAGRRFHAALRDQPRPAFFDDRDDVWAHAQRLVEDLGASAPHPALAAGFDARRPLGLTAQLVHGDLTGNVLLDDTVGPAVIDFSPYWQPPAWSSAIVVADALLLGAEPGLIAEIAAGEPVTADEFAQLVLRAVLFRTTTDVLAGRVPADLSPQSAGVLDVVSRPGQFLSGCGTGRPGCSPPRASR